MFRSKFGYGQQSNRNPVWCVDCYGHPQLPISFSATFLFNIQLYHIVRFPSTLLPSNLELGQPYVLLFLLYSYKSQGRTDAAT